MFHLLCWWNSGRDCGPLDGVVTTGIRYIYVLGDCLLRATTIATNSSNSNNNIAFNVIYPFVFVLHLHLGL
jgi:hypothetical protein